MVLLIRKGINFDEPINNMIERLKSEHRNFESKLQAVEELLTVIKILNLLQK